MAGLKMLARLVVCFLGFGIILASGRSSTRQQRDIKRAGYQKPNADTQVLESVTSSEVEYVDGPLAPLYDFLIQRRLQRFCKLLRDAGIEQILLDLGGSWTLFAPTDASFIFLPGGTLDELQKNPQLLRDFILYHFLAGDFPSSQIQNEMLVDTVQGSPLRFNIYGQTLTVSGAQIIEPDLVFDLGRVYIVDRPLYPIPSVDVISYLQRNHQQIYKLIVDVGLVEYISSGTFTILVPDDDAFNYLTVDLTDAMATNISLAERIILNHILPGSVFVGGIFDGMQWETVGGNQITFTIKRGLTFANEIPIVLSDIPLTNGVIHVINRVLLPEGVEADCHCKPSSETNKRSGSHVPGSSRTSFGQTQRPQYDQGSATRRPTLSTSRQTPRPFGSQTPGTSSISDQVRPSVSQGRPQTPATSNKPSGNRPWSSSRIDPTVKPLSPPAQTTRSPHASAAGDSQSEDDINSVVETGEQLIPGQKRDDGSRPSRYPPAPLGRPLPQRIPTRATQRPLTQTTSWQQRKQITLTTKQPTQRTTFQPSRLSPPPHRTTSRTSFVTPSAPLPPTNDQSFNSNRQKTCRQPGERVTPSTQNLPICSGSQPDGCQNSVYDPSDPRPKCPDSVTPECRESNEPYNSADNRPQCQTLISNQECRVFGQPTYIGDRRPLCSPATVPQTGCKDPLTPSNPSDRRPLCHTSPSKTVPPDTEENNSNQECREFGQPTYIGDRRPLCQPSSVPQTGCRDPSAPSNPSDRRPFCRPSSPTTVPPVTNEINTSQECRGLGQPTYIGDRRPLCPPTSVTQTGCQDSSEPFNPFNRNPPCRNVVTLPPNTKEIGTTPGCRKSDETANPQDRRPQCPDEPQEDCRPFLERPKPGDRRPVCKSPQRQPKPNKDSDDQKKQIKTQQQPTYPQRGQYPQTTRRQSWQSTTKVPQRSQLTTRAPQSWQSTRAPQSWQTTTARQPIGKQPQPVTIQTPQQPHGGSFQTNPQADSHQSQPGSISQPQSGLYPTGPESGTIPSQPQSETHASQPQSGAQSPSQTQSGRYPSHQQSGRYPTNQQSGRYPTNQQSGRYPSHQQKGTYQTQPQRGSHPSPPSGTYPSQPQLGTYPSQPHPGSHPSQQPQLPQISQPHTSSRPSEQPEAPSLPHSGTHSSLPQSGSHPSQPHIGGQVLRPQVGSDRPYQPQSGHGASQPGRPTTGYPQRQPGSHQSQSRLTTPTTQTQGLSQPGSSDIRPNQPFGQQGRPVSGQGHQSGSFTTPRQPTTRIPISVTGTSTTSGEVSKRTLYELVEDPALLIRGRPVKLTRIFALFHKAGLDDILTGPGPTTVFMPSDDAFSALPQGVVEQLEENPELLRQVLSYHVTKSEILPSAEGESYAVPSLEGTQLLITMLNGGRLILISGAKAVAVTRADNGIFYVINQLLYPLPHHDIVGAIQSRPDLSTLAWLLPMSGLTDLLQGQTPYTLLAPTDNAFAQLPQVVYDELTRNTTALQELLLNHIIEGAHYGREFLTGGTFPSARGGKLKFQVVSYGYQVNEVNIKTPEIVTGTGVIHLVDQVLFEDSDLRFITNLENSVAGEDGSVTNSQLTTVGGQAELGQPIPVGPRPVTSQRQPSLGHHAPGGHLSHHRHRIPGHQRTPSRLQIPGEDGSVTNSPQPTIRPATGQRQPSLGHHAPGSQLSHHGHRILGHQRTTSQPQIPGQTFGGEDVSVTNSPQLTVGGQAGLGQPVLIGSRPVSGQRQPSLGHHAPGGHLSHHRHRIPGHQRTPSQPQIAGEDGSVTNSPQPTVGGQEGLGQPIPVDPRPVSGQRQPSLGHHSPGGQLSRHGHRFPGHQRTHNQPQITGEDGSVTNSPLPTVGGQEGLGQPIPVDPKPVSGQRQPSLGHHAPGGQLSRHGHRFPGHQRTPSQPQIAGQTLGDQQQPNIGSFAGPTYGQQTSGQPLGPSSFSGRHQSSPQGQPDHGQQPGQQLPGQSGHTSSGGNRVSTNGQRTQTGIYTGQRQPAIQTAGHVSSGLQDHRTFERGGQTNDVAELARTMGLNQFANWVTNTGLLEKIHDGGVYTVFAPTDDAVNSLPQDMVNSIESNPEQVKAILQYHIVPQRLNLNSVTNEETASTLLNGKTIRFNVYQNSQPDCKQLVTASGTPVGESLATMGSIQVIPVTQVLYQPAGNLLKIVEASPILQKLNEAVKSARMTWLLSGSGPVTIFAPSDTAFDALTVEQRKALVEDKQAFSDLLKRHMVRGTFFSSGIQDDIEKKSENSKPIKISLQEGILTVNSVPVTYSDITATNGVLHVIDHFL